MRASGNSILNNKNKKARIAGFFVTKWLGCRDSNPGMLVSETRALPLGDTPIALNKLLNDFLNWLGYEDSNLGMPESESGALPLGDTPTICLDYRKIDNLNLVATTGFEPVTPSL